MSGGFAIQSLSWKSAIRIGVCGSTFVLLRRCLLRNPNVLGVVVSGELLGMPLHLARALDLPTIAAGAAFHHGARCLVESAEWSRTGTVLLAKWEKGQIDRSIAIGGFVGGC